MVARKSSARRPSRANGASATGLSTGRKAITTRYIGPTNSRGSRIKAMAEGGLSITVPYDYGLSADGNHLAAAIALANKHGWGGHWVGGGMGTGEAFVDVSRV
jgi:hypothetical protein